MPYYLTIITSQPFGVIVQYTVAVSGEGGVSGGGRLFDE